VDFWNNRLYTGLLAAILLSLSYPPFPLPFLQIPAIMLLLRLAQLCESKREVAYWSYPVFVLWNLAITYWLMMATLAGGIAAILANSVLMTIPLVLMYKIQNSFNNALFIALSHGAIWTAYEFLHHHWDLAWPWLTLGNGWSMVTPLVQYISVTGVWGVSFWVVVLASMTYQLALDGSNRRFYSSIAVAIIPPFLSLILLFQYQDSPAGNANVIVVQPDFNSYERLGGYSSSEEALNNLTTLSDSLINGKVDIDAVFWPENAVRPALYEHERDGLTPALRDKSASWNAMVVTGTTYFDFFSDEEAPSLVRTRNDKKYIYYNAALAFQPDGEKNVYKKGKLVPIVERIPFLNFLYNANLFGIEWEEMGWLGKGRKMLNFEHDSLRAPALICYDSVFPGWVRKSVEQNANLLSVITNDGWWGRTSGHIQHFHYARLRAIENRRWIVRSANNGISGIIDATGDVLKSTQYKQKTAFAFNVPLLERKTIYTKTGPWLPLLCFLWIIIVMCIYYYNLISRKNLSEKA